MKWHKTTRVWLPACALLMTIALLPAAADTFIVDTKGSTVWLQGTAGPRRWKCISKAVEGHLVSPVSAEQAREVFAGAGSDRVTRLLEKAETTAGGSTNMIRGLISLPAVSLKSGDAAMEADLLEALKADRHPDVVCEFTGIRDLRIVPPPEHPTLALQASGRLTLAGATRPIEIELGVYRDGPYAYRVHGVHTICMSDFGITPPSALFGLIRAGDEVTITFNLVLTPPSAPHSP